MAKRQTRRSISINRAQYEQMKEIAAAASVPLSKITEAALKNFVATARETGRDTWITRLGEMARTPA